MFCSYCGRMAGVFVFAQSLLESIALSFLQYGKERNRARRSRARAGNRSEMVWLRKVLILYAPAGAYEANCTCDVSLEHRVLGQRSGERSIKQEDRGPRSRRRGGVAHQHL